MSDGEATAIHQRVQTRSRPSLEVVGRPAAAVARELGLRRNHLYKWPHELDNVDEAAFPGKGGRAHRTDELTRLRRQNARLREERDILKKAAGFFARESP